MASVTKLSSAKSLWLHKLLFFQKIALNLLSLAVEFESPLSSTEAPSSVRLGRKEELDDE